jgi:Ca2+-transporting ATPase
VFFQLVNSFCVRSGDRSVFSRHSLSNRSLLWALVAVVVMQILIVQVSFFEKVFETVPLTLSEWAWAVVVPLSLLVVEELRKLVVRARS